MLPGSRPGRPLLLVRIGLTLVVHSIVHLQDPLGYGGVLAGNRECLVDHLDSAITGDGDAHPALVPVPRDVSHDDVIPRFDLDLPALLPEVNVSVSLLSASRPPWAIFGWLASQRVATSPFSGIPPGPPWGPGAVPRTRLPPSSPPRGRPAPLRPPTSRV